MTSDIFATDLLRLDHSYGYDCQRLYNLCSLQGDTLVYSTGRLIHFYDINTGQLQYMPTTKHQGVGHLTTHSTRPLLAVGEKGDTPPIVIWKWPELEVAVTLEGAAQAGYACLTFNGGTLLASMSSAPDHLLTLWLWEEGQILLQAQAYHQPVYAVAFSQFHSGQLATCGVGHVKIWRMSETFTGLKLEGELCRFGATEACDVTGVVVLPDGACATGSSWGELLVWQGAAIRVQVCRVGRLPCHAGPITQLVFHNGALLSAGMDGAIRAWDCECLMLADVDEDDNHIEIEPVFELILSDGAAVAQISSLCKANSDPDDNMWLAQDHAGAIWSIEISPEGNTKPAKRILCSHAGPVVAVEASPAVSMMATLGADCRVIIYDYVEKTIITSRELDASAQGTCLVWLPLKVSPSGNLLLAGFSDGVVRLLGLEDNRVIIMQTLKPHTLKIVSMAVESNQLITASAYRTVFMIQLEIDSPLKMEPVGFCRTTADPSCSVWMDNTQFLVGCMNGSIQKFRLPSDQTFRTEKSFYVDLTMTTHPVGKLAENSPDDKMPDYPNNDSRAIQFMYKNARESVIFSFTQAPGLHILNFETGCVSLFEGSSHVPCITSYLPREKEGGFLLGLSDGQIKAMNSTTYAEMWTISVHDKDYGCITGLTASWDGRYIFSCGKDGGVFSFEVPSAGQQTPPVLQESAKLKPLEMSPSTKLSLEECKIQASKDAQNEAAEKHKTAVLGSIAELRSEYLTILSANNNLPQSLRFSTEDLIPDQRVVDHLNRKLGQKMQQVHKMLAHDLERSCVGMNKIRSYFLDNIETLTTRVSAIHEEHFVETFRVSKLPEGFFENLATVQKKLDEIDAQVKIEEEIKLSLWTESVPVPPEVSEAPRAESPDPVEGLMKQLSAVGEVSRSRKLTTLWRQHASRRAAAAARSAVWEELMRRQPDTAVSGHDQHHTVESARDTLGDYKLKTSEDYKVPRHKNETTVSKFKALMDAKLRMQQLMNTFNGKVLAMRTKKQEIIREHTRRGWVLQRISTEIPEESRKIPPPLPTVNTLEEFPEVMFTLSNELVHENSVELVVEDAVGECSCGENLVKDSLEAETHELHVLKRIEYQNSICQKIDEDIESFNSGIRRLGEEKEALQLDLKFLELHLLTLHREILILQQYEEEEEAKLTNVFNLMKGKYDLQLKMNELTAEMEAVVHEINSREENVKGLVSTFLVTISENKFYEFLKKLFNQKYRPSTGKSDRDGSCSIDSESVFDGDDGKHSELSSFDEGCCPEGCDRALYEHTFERRSSKEKLEREIWEKKRVVDALKERFADFAAQMSQVDLKYERAQKECLSVQRRKQAELNKIETVVLLRLSQMQNFKSQHELESLENSLVLSSDLLSQLYCRVGELSRETQQQKERHTQNKLHIQQLGIDIRYMTEQVLLLEKEKDREMQRKFGCKVDLDELDEALIKKLVAEMHFIPFDLQKKLDVKLNTLRRKLAEKVDSYQSRLIENTKRYNILTVLKDEHRKLDGVLEKQETVRTRTCKTPDSSEIEKLTKLVKNQEERAAKLREEISCLRQKSCPLPMVNLFPSETAPMEDSIWIEAPDGNSYEVSLTVWQRIRAIAADAEDLFADFQTGCKSPGTTNGLKDLVEGFMAELPEAVLCPVWELLCEGRDSDLSNLLEEQPYLSRAAHMMMNIVASAKERSAYFKE